MNLTRHRLDLMKDGAVVRSVRGDIWRDLYDVGVEWVWQVPADVYWNDDAIGSIDELPDGRDFILVEDWHMGSAPARVPAEAAS